MKRQGFALVAGAALVAGLIGANFGVAQANAGSTAARPQEAAVVCGAANGAEPAVVRAAAPAPANSEVTCSVPEQVGTPTEGGEQPAVPKAGEAGEITAVDASVGISKAPSPKEVNGQIIPADAPSYEATTVDASQ